MSGYWQRIAEKTEDAFSYDRYTPAGWRAVALYLEKTGFQAHQAETILRSKWMRWAADTSSRAYGRENSKSFIEAYADGHLGRSIFELYDEQLLVGEEPVEQAEWERMDRHCPTCNCDGHSPRLHDICSHCGERHYESACRCAARHAGREK